MRLPNKPKVLPRLAGVIALGCVLFIRLSAQTIVYGGFASTSGLRLNGTSVATSTDDGTVLRLVPASVTHAGSAFTTTQVSFTGFSTAFEFRLTSPGSSSEAVQPGADGLTFALQTVSASSIGATGGGLGYQGISSSVAVEFDTFRNIGTPIFDSSSNHVGVDTGGSLNSIATANVENRFDNGNKWTAWVDYDSSTHTLEVRVSESGVRPNSALLTQSINIANTLDSGTAYVGFTAGTGGAYANHDLLNWTFSPSFVSGGVSVSAVPEPSTTALLGLGVILVLGGRRLFRRAP